MEDFLEQEEFLELEDGEKLEDLDSSREASHPAVHEHQRPPICAEEAAGFHKRVKMIHDPVKIVVPCAVFEVEFPIPPDKGAHMSSYVEMLENHQHVEASQRGLRFRDEASHPAVHEHQRPPIYAEEAAGFHKRVKMIHDPVKIVVPCAVFEVEFPIPPDKGAHLSSYVE
ncbi:hypothetical protein HID58_066756, partial [Brassica napus]